MLRITGGERRGANLFSPKGQETRPALARLRVRVFDVLGERVAGASVADLFAGSGAMGLEALSRGAASCAFFEQSPAAVKSIHQNLEKLRYVDRASVVRGDVYRARIPPVDLVFVDPPYAEYRERPERLAALLERAAGKLYVIEHTAHDRFAESGSGLKVIDRRDFGRTVVSLAVRRGH